MNVLHPTVVMGLGPFGAQVSGYIRDRLQTGGQLAICDAAGPHQVARALEEAAAPLLVAGREGASGRPRLDIFMVCLALDHDDDLWLQQSVQAATRLISTRYGALFSRAEGQRGATLHLVVVAAPLRSRPGAQALLRLRPVEEWARDPSTFPLLARVWIMSPATSAGTLTPDDVIRSCGAFGIGLFGAGLRNDQAIASRIEHRAGGLFGFFSVACVDLPRCRLRSYAAVGAVHEGLATLVDRVEQGADIAMARQRVAALASDSWARPFTRDGAAGQRCLQLAGRMTGGDRVLPDTIIVRPLDEAEQLRDRYPVLFQQATLAREENRADAEALNALIDELDREESRVLGQVDSSIQTVFARELPPSDGLSNLPLVQSGLKVVRAELEDAANRDAGATDSGGPVDEDPERAGIEAALAGMPRRRAVVAQSLAIGAVSWFAVVALTMAGLRDATLNDQAVRQYLQLGWAGGLVVALLTAGLVGWWTGRRSRDGVRWALQRRRDAVRDLWDRGGGGATGRQGQAQLRQRRLRVRRGAIVALDQALEQLEAVRTTLMDARDHALDRLARISGQHESRAGLEDLEHLLGDPTTFHAPLLGAHETGLWLRAARKNREAQKWASRLLEESWPARGLNDDVPCSDEAALRRLGLDQTEPLARSQVFADPARAEVATAIVAEFARRVPANLEKPLQPQNEDGSPHLGDGNDRVVVLAPTSARSWLEEAFSGGQLANLPVHWGDGSDERVIFLRTWQGYDLVDIVRGSRS